MTVCSTDGCNRPAARASQVHDGRICKVCYTKEWHDRQGPCSLWHCDRRIDAGDLCTTHYNRKRRGVPDWDAPVPRHMKRDGTCRHEDGCPEPVQARGYCAMHYQRIAVLGYADAGPVGRLKAVDGAGGDDGRGYWNITVGGKKRSEHRWVMEQRLGRPLEPDEEVHHRNRIRADNDRCPRCPPSTPPPVVLGVADDAHLYCSACGWSGPKPNLELWVTPQPRGGRAEDLVAFYVGRYPELAARALAEVRRHGRSAGVSQRGRLAD